MKVIAFYSFKGGVGRTMSLLATAYTLAQRGRKVVVADWDLHAPGLSLMECMQPADDGPPQRGVLEYLLSWQPKAENRGQTPLSDSVVRPRLIEDAKARHADTEFAMKGDLQFIPAGNLSGGIDSFLETVNKLQHLRISEFLLDVDEDPRLLFKVFRIRVEQTDFEWRGEGQDGAPDYLLLDCRTGITEISDLLLGEATDFNVIVYGQDEQNLKGLSIVLNASPRRPGDLIANTMLIWSGAVTGQEEMKAEQRKRKRRIIEEVCKPDSLGLREPWPKEFENPFNPDLVLSDLPLVHRVPDSWLGGQFREITDFLEERCLWRDTIVEAHLTTPGDTPEQKAMKLAKASEYDRTQAVWSASTSLKLTTGLEQILFNPPPFNFAAVDMSGCCAIPSEPDVADARQRLVRLLPYSISLTAVEKLRILQGDKLSEFQISELARIITDERNKWFAVSPVHFWAVLRLSVSSGLEWLAALRGIANSEDAKSQGLPDRAGNVLHECISALLHGEPVESLPESSLPNFLVLQAEALKDFHKTVPQALTEYFPEGKLSVFDTQIGLFRRFLETGGTSDPDVECFVTAALAVTLDERGRVSTEDEKSSWFDRAIAAYEKSLQLRPDHAATLYNLGNSLDNRGRASAEEEKSSWFDRAIAAYEKSLELRPDHAATLTNLGISLANRGRASAQDEKSSWFDRAIAACEKSLELRPDHADTLTNLGNSLDNRGRASAEDEKSSWFDRAIAAYEKSLQLRPDHAATLYNLGISLANRGRASAQDEKSSWFDRAIAAYEKSLQLRPDHAATLNNLGISLANRGRAAAEDEKSSWFDRAIAAYEKSLQLRPDHAATLYNLGNSLDNRGRASAEDEKSSWFDRAIAAYEKSLQLRPDHADTLNNLGISLDNRGRASAEDEKSSWFDRAIAAYEKSLQLRPDHADTIGNYASSMIHLGYACPDQAQQRLSDALDVLRPVKHDAGCHFNLCCVLSLLNRPDDCLNELAELLSAHPDRKEQTSRDRDFSNVADRREFIDLIAPFQWNPS